MSVYNGEEIEAIVIVGDDYCLPLGGKLYSFATDASYGVGTECIVLSDEETSKYLDDADVALFRKNHPELVPEGFEEPKEPVEYKVYPRSHEYCYCDHVYKRKKPKALGGLQYRSRR